MSAMITDSYRGVDKVKRYGWTIKHESGELRYLAKEILKIHPDYQRDATIQKVTEITAKWSWISCGAIVVGYRDGDYWVLDGQHRVLAAKRRSDIIELPCVIYKTQDIKQEAAAFLELNTGRKPVAAIAKFKAMVVAGDEDALIVNDALNKLGLIMKPCAKKPNEIKCIGWALKKAKENKLEFFNVLTVAKHISPDTCIQEKLLSGLWYLNRRIDGGLLNKKLLERLIKIGAEKLTQAAAKASAYFGMGGEKIWGTGMLEEINKGLRVRFVITENANHNDMDE